ncbi:MAG: chloride channel protein [Crocinitomicaceae bacterium]|jgi:CIC family chloride channel protein|nr:chloride channel protein [Crocinitomicaceae bacterium]
MRRQWFLKTFAAGFNRWKQSDQSMMGWAVVTGCSAGLLAVLLKRTVGVMHFGMNGIAEFFEAPWWLGIGPLMGLLATRWVVRNWLRGDHPGPGVPSILHALSQRQGRIKRMWMFAPLITSSLSVGLGGSGGLEGPSLQSASAIGSEIGRQTKRAFNRRMLLIGCAASASLAALFKAPVAAIIFAVEVIMIDLTAASLVPLLLASLAGLITASLFQGQNDILTISNLAEFELKTLPWYLLLGTACGVGSVFFSKLYLGASQAITRLPSHRLRIWVAGIGIGAALLLFPSLYGEGYQIVNALFDGQVEMLASGMQLQSLELNGWMLIGFLMLAWVLKPVLTGMTLGAGGVAGVFAPAIFCGALLGHQFAIVTEWLSSSIALPMGHAVLAGLAGMLAGVLHAPLTAILLTAEVSGGYALFVPVMLTSAISFRISKRWMKHTVYTRELAERGELLTHDKDQTILTLMNLMDQVESDHEVVNPHWTLGQLIPIIERSRHDVFPVLDRDGHLLGLVELQEIREVMFDRELYDTMRVHEMMNIPVASIDASMRMDKVMAIFERTGAWRLPVLSGDEFKGFVSRTNLLSNYRNWLKASSIE